MWGATGTEVRGLAVTGDNLHAVGVVGAQEVVLTQLWVHGAAGRGIDVESVLEPTSVTVDRSLVEQNHEIGVFIAGSEAMLTGSVIRDTLPQQSDQLFGRGIDMQPHLNTNAPARVVVTGCLVEQNHEFGVFVAGSEATLTGSVIRDTLPRQSDQLFGRGINIQPELPSGAEARLFVTGSLVERAHEIGVFVAGSEATLEGVVIRDTLPQQSDQRGGRGISIQAHPNGAPARVAVTGSVVEHNYSFGVAVAESQATLAGLLVRDTLPRASDGLYGDGIAFVSEPNLASGVITGSWVTESARAGLSSFGAGVTLGGSALHCNTIDLNGEVSYDLPFVFEDLGGNGCGRPEATGACKAISSGLAPPEPLDAP